MSITTTNSLVLFSLKTSSSNTRSSCRFQAFSFNPIFKTKKNILFGRGGGGGRGLSRNAADGSVQISRGTIYRSRDVSVYSSILPSGGPVIPSGSAPSGSWKSWILGMVLTLIIPFWGNKWGPLLQLKRKVENVVQTVEDIAEAVEEVAEKVEEMADEFGDHLPAGKLKDAADFIENAAKEIAKDAHLADEIIDKVQEMDKEIETMAGRVNDQVDQVNDKVDEISKDVKDLKN